jgi:hypothetical protein
MLSTANSTAPVAPPQPPSAVSREMVMEMITSALSYMPEIGGKVKHRTLEGELWLRVRFDDALIEIVNENETVSFRLVPVLANPPASIGTLEI